MLRHSAGYKLAGNGHDTRAIQDYLEGSASPAGPPGASGDTARPNYMGPSGNGLVERMKAGESPRNQGRSYGRPCPSPEGGPEDEGKRRGGAPIGAPVRVMGRQFPPAEGTGFAVRRANGCGVPRPRISALRFPLFGIAPGFETDNLARQSAGMRRAATFPHGSTTRRKETMPKFLHLIASLSTVMPALDAGIHEAVRRATPYGCYPLRSIMDCRVRPGNDERWVWRNQPKGSYFGETNPRTGFGETNPSARA